MAAIQMGGPSSVLLEQTYSVERRGSAVERKLEIS
jgi:hypothetical protein